MADERAIKALTTLTQAKEMLLEQERERQAEKMRDSAEKRALREAEKDTEKKLREVKKEARQILAGPDKEQISADVGMLFVGEGLYRLVAFGLQKLGLSNWIWYTAPFGVTGTLMYVLTYPRKEEGLVRKLIRSLGFQWIITSSHDAVGSVLGNAQARAQAVASLQQQNAALVQQLQAQGGEKR